jgi:pimeloyl-ACP methyl ester carboxylesterase
MKPLFFKEQGSGPSLVFLHGFCETSEIWDDFVKPFSKDFRVVTIDLPGFGNSEMLPSPFSIDQVGDIVAETLVKNKISDCVLIGHSLGGYVALSLLQNHPQLLKGLGLFHSSAFADPEEKKENRNKVIEFVKKNGVPPFLDTFVPGLFFDKKNPYIDRTFEIAAQAKAITIQEYSAAMRDRPDRSALWKESAITKLLIAGIEDAVIPMKVSLELAKIGRNVSFQKLEKTGHMGFFEAKRESQEMIKRFTYQIFSIK